MIQQILLTGILATTALAAWFGYGQIDQGNGQGAPSAGNIVRDVLPETDSSYDIGTNSRRFQNIYTDNADVSGNIIFDSVTGNQWSDFCVSITGSADLCDGSDDGAGGGSGDISNWEISSGALTPTTTDWGILVNTASSTIPNLVVSDSLSGAGFDSAFNTGVNASSTIAWGLCSDGEVFKASGGAWICGTDNNSGGASGGGAWEKYITLASPSDIITPTTTNASIYVSGNATTTGNFTANDTLYVKDGNVGVGTSTPKADLHVEDASGFGSIKVGSISGINAALEFEEGGARMSRIQWNAADSGLSFHVSDAGAGTNDDLFINTSGQVGIGLNSPSANLHVQNSVAGTIASQVYIENDANTTGTGSGILFLADDSGGTSTFYGGMSYAIADNTDTSEDGTVNIREMVAGSLRNVMSFISGETIITAPNDGTVTFKSFGGGSVEVEGSGFIQFDGVGFNFQEDGTTYGTLNGNNWCLGESCAGTPAYDFTVGADNFGINTNGSIQAQAGIPDSLDLAVKSAERISDGTADPQLDMSSNRGKLLFDASSDETAYWTFIMPDTYSSNMILKADLIYSMASASSGNVVWDVAVMAQTSADAADIDTDSFATTNSHTDAVPAAAGRVLVDTITLTNADSAAAKDIIQIRVNRDADNGSDTATGDAELRSVRIYWD